MADGGEFLLHLLRNPPQHNPRQPSPRAPPAQALPDDPAVAAVGPTISYPPPLNQSKDLDHLPYRPPWSNSPPHFAPHSFFLQNPNPNLPSASALRPGFDKTSDQLNHKLFDAEDVLKSGIFGKNPTSDSAHHQQVHSDLMFGSFHDNAGLSNVNINQLKTSDRDVGLPNKIQNGLEIGFQKSPENNRNRELNTHKFVDHGGNSRWAGTQVRRPPPGFSSNPRSVGKKSSGFEKNTSKGKSKVGGLNRRNVATDSEDKKERALGSRMYGETNLSVQLDSPGQPSGSNLHSVTASDIEKSLSELHGEVRSDGMRTDGAKVRTELEDLDEQIGTLVLENGSSENDDNKKQQNARDKDYRSDKRGKWILNQRMRSARRRIECRTDINQLNYPFLSIYESLIPSEEEKGKQKQLLALLEKHVNKEWPDARLYVYGSCANSFGFRKSDIDVCLAIEDTDVNKCEILLKLAEILQSDNLQNVQALTRARVPIVKLMDPVIGISCDICVNNLLAVVNTKLLRDYAHIDGRLRQLAFIVKHWAKSRGVNETYQGTLSSYAYVLMCIHFLQQRTPAILPCLQGMERTYAVNVDNTECAYFDQVENLNGFGSRNGESIAQLIWAFFNYWAYYHDYTNDVISVRTGSILSKHEKDWTRRIGIDRHLICIEDPFEITHDLGRVVDKHSIRVLREEFERAAEIMQYDVNPCVTLFEPYLPS